MQHSALGKLRRTEFDGFQPWFCPVLGSNAVWIKSRATHLSHAFRLPLARIHQGDEWNFPDKTAPANYPYVAGPVSQIRDLKPLRPPSDPPLAPTAANVNLKRRQFLSYCMCSLSGWGVSFLVEAGLRRSWLRRSERQMRNESAWRGIEPQSPACNIDR